MAARKWLRRLLEDGFLRSVDRDDASLSLVFEDLGIYYDASSAYAFFRIPWVPLLLLLKVLSAWEPMIYVPRSGSD